LSKENYQDVCQQVVKISPYVRFVGVVGENGKLLAFIRRKGLKPLLDTQNTLYQFSHIAIKSDLESYFDKSLGEIEFVWEERQKAQIISFAIKKDRVWVSIDKKVVRTEILRIIDSCLPIVKHHST